MVILQLGRHRVMMISHQIPGYFSSKFSNIRTEFSGVSARDTQKFDEKNRIKEALPMGKANTSVAEGQPPVCQPVQWLCIRGPADHKAGGTGRPGPGDGYPGHGQGGKDKGCGKAQGYCETLEEHGESGDPGLRIPG